MKARSWLLYEQTGHRCGACGGQKAPQALPNAEKATVNHRTAGNELYESANFGFQLKNSQKLGTASFRGPITACSTSSKSPRARLSGTGSFVIRECLAGTIPRSCFGDYIHSLSSDMCDTASRGCHAHSIHPVCCPRGLTMFRPHAHECQRVHIIISTHYSAYYNIDPLALCSACVSTHNRNHIC